MADEKDLKKDPQIVNDVKKAEDVPAGATARPIIVSHGSMLKDPMVQPAKEEAPPEPAEESVEPASRVQKNIEPDPKPEEPASDETAAKVEEPEVPEPKKEEVKDEVKTSSAAAVDALAGEAVKDKDDKKDVAAEAERAEHIEKLVAEKQYFVKLSASNQQKSKRLVVVLFVLLLLAIVGLELAIDAGIVDIGVDPVVDLIK